jgi:hypothetical protein
MAVKFMNLSRIPALEQAVKITARCKIRLNQLTGRVVYVAQLRKITIDLF